MIDPIVTEERAEKANPADPLPVDSDEHRKQSGARWRVVLFSISILLIFALVVIWRAQSRIAEGDTNAAPDFALTTFHGETVQLSELRGKGVVVNFWASWCAPCRAEAPILERLWQREKDNGIVFLGVDYLDQDANAQKFIDEFGITYPNGADANNDIAADYNITGVPATFFIGPDGTFVASKIGEIRTEAELDDFLEQIRPAINQ